MGASWHLPAALRFRDLPTPRAIVNALHRSNLNLQSQQTIFKIISQYIDSSSLRHYMENVNEHEKEFGQNLEGWHREANAALTKLQNTIIEYCINHTDGIFVSPPSHRECFTRALD